MIVATTILNNNNVVRTIKTSENGPGSPAEANSMDQNDSEDYDSGSRDISTVNTNRLKQIFDTYRNGIEPSVPPKAKIAVYDMGMART